MFPRIGQPLIALVLSTLWVTAAGAQVAPLLDFEQGADHELAGWGGGPPDTLSLDLEQAHGGRRSAHIERGSGRGDQFSTFTSRVDLTVEGDLIELRGSLRTEGVSAYAGFWLRQDGPAGTLGFAGMQDNGPRGDTDWAPYSISLRRHPDATSLYFGFLLVGAGRAWADDLELLVDGVPYDDAPQLERVETVLDTDREFASGSGLEQTLSLSGQQIENLAVLGKVWGFLKAHHPRIAAGELHWDFELFRVLPAVLHAPDADRRNQRLRDWATERLGAPPACNPCAGEPIDVHLRPRIAWIRDRTLLGDELSVFLASVHRNRFSGGSSFYVDLAPGVGNPVFRNEPAYQDLDPLDAGYRILALFRLWNMIEYWFPYRDLIDDWDEVLREHLPRLAAADDRRGYELEMLRLIVRIHDTHANLWNALQSRPPTGACTLPVALRFLPDASRESEIAVISSFLHPELGPDTGLRAGDILVSIDGRPVMARVDELLPYYAGSNRPVRLLGIASGLLRGACEEMTLTLRRAHPPSRDRDLGDDVEELTLTPKRVPIDRLEWIRTHDRPGETFQLLSKQVAYLKLSSITVAEITDHLERAAQTSALVIDIRNYPSEFVVFALGGRLIEERTPFVRFTQGDLSNPGAFSWTPPLELSPSKPRYEGRVAILVDEVSLSQAEYTAMALRVAPGAIVVGSTTAGADGNVSPIVLPGGLRTGISGIGVFYPDRRPTQRIGIVPDVEVTPSVEGLRDGRDEVLEQALRELLGGTVDEHAIRRLAAPP